MEIITAPRELNAWQTSAELTSKDILGAWKARWGINRMNYKVEPGLYKLGNPDDHSPVLVTANYKMSFDYLRKELSGLNGWILVLDTKGINVWCAAGKGTFGTQELLDRMSIVQLDKFVSHREIIVPQLGAVGISAHMVAKYSGYKVIYGPVRSEDIKEFFKLEMKATPEMRTVRFSMYDRLVLTPMELVATFKISLMVFGVLFLLNLLGLGPFGIVDFYAYVGAVLVGCVLTPVLLPWIPGRAFAWKGWILGFIWAVVVNMLNGWNMWTAYPQYGVLRALAYILILPSVAAYLAMNFTGSSTFTSYSGVLKEMRQALPVIIITLGLGIILLLVGSFV